MGKEAPPGRVAKQRFHQAARWFLALVDGALFPLRRVLWPQFPSPPLDDGLHREIQTDASPWGGG
eukprot:1814142-Amphidinium_carterae.1